MRVWLDPERLACLQPRRRATWSRALREQNLQVASGVIGQPPVPPGSAVPAPGQHARPAARRRSSSRTSSSRPAPTAASRACATSARIELGARDYAVNSYLDNQPAVAMAVVAAARARTRSRRPTPSRSTMAELSKSFPDGLEYRIVYNPTVFVRESINAVIHTLFEAVGARRDRRARLPAELARQRSSRCSPSRCR